jgi:hypothetical protein
MQAVQRLRTRKYLHIGVHLILGIPGEVFADMLATVQAVCEAGVEHMKIHHLQVIEGTELEKMYRQRPFTTFDVHEYMDIVSRLLMSVPSHVVMHRLWSISATGIIIAPFWDLSQFEMGKLLRQTLFLTDRRQGKLV